MANSCVMVTGYQYEKENNIFSYALLAIQCQDFTSRDCKIEFGEIKDIVQLETSDYPDRKEDVEFKLVDYPEQ